MLHKQHICKYYSYILIQKILLLSSIVATK